MAIHERLRLLYHEGAFRREDEGEDRVFYGRERLVSHLDATARETVERLVEEGREVVTSTLPCLIAVVKDINEPRFPNFMGIRRANKMEYPVWSAQDLCDETGAQVECFGLIGSPTKVTRVFTPPVREGGCDLIPADDIARAASALAERILAEKIL